MKLSWTLFLCLCCAITSFQSCSDDPLECNDPTNILCPNYNPCAGFNLPFASMSIHVELDGPSCLGMETFSRQIEEDTFVLGQRINFLSRTDRGVHHWDIGGLIQETGDEIANVDFTNVANGDLQVRLIEEIADPDNCIEAEMRSDTSYRDIFLRFWNGSADGAPPIYGVFDNSYMDPELPDAIRIPRPEENLQIAFPTSECDTVFLSFETSYRDAIFYSDADQCMTICGFAHVPTNNDEIVLNYSRQLDNGAVESKTFFGVRR